MTKPKNTVYVKPGQKEDKQDSSGMYGAGYDEAADKAEQLETLRRLHKENPDVYPDPDAPVLGVDFDIDRDDVTPGIETNLATGEETVVQLHNPEIIADNLGLIDKDIPHSPPFEPVGMLLGKITDVDPVQNSDDIEATITIKNSEPYLTELMERFISKEDVVICILPKGTDKHGGELAESS